MKGTYLNSDCEIPSFSSLCGVAMPLGWCIAKQRAFPANGLGMTVLEKKRE